MEKKVMQTTILVLFLLISITEGQMNTINTTQGTFITDCFSDFNDGLCDSSLITVGDNLYACGSMAFAGPGLTINRIGFIDGQILVSRGDSFIYGIRENGQLYPVNKTLIPRSGNLVDQNNNVYFNADGTTYVGLRETGKEVTIDTLGEKSFNQLAFDGKSNTLYILAVKANHLYNPPDVRISRERGLYAVKTNPLNIDQNHIQAVLLEGIDNITALAIEPESQNLLIGMDTTHGNKFMRLIKLQENPCPRRSPLRYLLSSQLAEFSEKLEDMCMDAYYIVNRGGSPTQEEFSIAYNKLVNEKKDLTEKLESLSKCTNVANRASNTPKTQTITSTEQINSPNILTITPGIQKTSTKMQTILPKIQITTLETPPIGARQLVGDIKPTCPPPSPKELENKKLTIEVDNVTESYNRVVGKLKALVTKMNSEKDLLNEEETTTVKEPVYREARMCPPSFKSKDLPKKLNMLKKETQQLRTQLIEFVGKFKKIYKSRNRNEKVFNASKSNQNKKTKRIY